ncbi:M1 family metallopeptidase [Imhoffiella purpurea]|uniref:PDZ domain protein n=1 Tax=Imhoffiella purpurea TaxID=1249627 RepID=W9VGG2_9GAMM|nr:M1 family aminopeptidase [Imhoffiella purpurea]EXJ15127.1 PDZ domain protein [Imhoffiella purpurea]
MSPISIPLPSLARLVLLLVLPLTALADPPLIGHRLSVGIDPDTGSIAVQDRIRFPDDRTEWPILLHSGLDPRVESGDAELVPNGRWHHLDRYLLQLGETGPVTLTYGGIIRHDLESIDAGMGRSRQASPGTIQPDGVFLDGFSAWYPRVPDALQAFEIDVRLPEGWIAVSQGEGPGDPANGHSRWREDHPQDDIYLVAAPFDLYRADADGIEAQVYLRRPDPELAERYLEATRRYLRLYSDMIGPYPYTKFALVENFWESGYGMPSFTLLGPRVIRLPFIIHTSYPHEILHNWWGNGVYVDDDSGNWSEGITNYLADYWLKEREGRGVEQRRDMLKDYGDYVRTGKDFPLTEFRAKHGSASQAIGYNKGAMFFHMLRRRLGDDVFREGLRRFYADNRFRAAGFADWRSAFESVSGQDLGKFFDAWTRRSGAPRLTLSNVQSMQTKEGFQVTGTVRQDQTEPPFPLLIPVRIDLREGPPIHMNLRGDGRETHFTAKLDSAPTQVAVDPEFDLFRQLLPGETPVTLSNLLGTDRGIIVLPARAPQTLMRGYRRLAEAWKDTQSKWEIRSDAELSGLPKEGAVLLLGWENALIGEFAAGSEGFALDPSQRQLKLADTRPHPDGESLVLTRRSGNRPLAWLATATPEALPALARKVPHYGRYSYLLFSGPEATNRLKGQWPSGDSALVHRFEPDRP